MNLKKNDCHKTYTSKLSKLFEYLLLFLFQLSLVIIHLVVVLADSIKNVKKVLENNNFEVGIKYIEKGRLRKTFKNTKKNTI